MQDGGSRSLLLLEWPHAGTAVHSVPLILSFVQRSSLVFLCGSLLHVFTVVRKCRQWDRAEGALFIYSQRPAVPDSEWQYSVFLPVLCNHHCWFVEGVFAWNSNTSKNTVLTPKHVCVFLTLGRPNAVFNTSWACNSITLIKHSVQSSRVLRRLFSFYQ